jgi:betaine-aldehyde dehydrogenase
VTSEVLKNLVNGEYVAAAAGRTSPVVDPSTGEEYARAPVSGTAGVEAAMHAAAGAFEGWRDTTPAERSLALLRMAEAVILFVSEMPHGGFKHSGYGKDLSMYGFEDYTRIKHVMSYLGG